VIEKLTPDRHPQARHVREIRRTQPARMMNLIKKHLLGRTLRRPPPLHPTLQRPQLTVLKPPRVLPLEPLEKRLRLMNSDN
jgi:hypothetical protein